MSIRFHFPCARCGRLFRALVIQSTCSACTLAEAEVYPAPLRAEISGA